MRSARPSRRAVTAGSAPPDDHVSAATPFSTASASTAPAALSRMRRRLCGLPVDRQASSGLIGLPLLHPWLVGLLVVTGPGRDGSLSRPGLLAVLTAAVDPGLWRRSEAGLPYGEPVRSLLGCHHRRWAAPCPAMPSLR